MERILVTGATGFIGSALVKVLADRRLAVTAAYRGDPPPLLPPHAEAIQVGQLGPDTRWDHALAGVSQIVHLAGPAHGVGHFERGIVAATRCLAEAARQHGVARFVFVSSIKAAADRSGPAGVSERDMASPGTPYGAAKRAAERLLMDVLGPACVVLRPPLVFAPHAKANFARLLRLSDSGIPMPLEGIENRRSLISLPTLGEALLCVLLAPYDRFGLFHVTGSPPVSTAQLVASLRQGMKRPSGLFRSRLLAALLPRQFTETLVVDDSLFRNTFGWRGQSDLLSDLVECGSLWKRAHD